MPITTAHPALVLPLLRRVRAGGWVSGLVIGSMIPDIIQAFWDSRLPHEPLGALALDVPVAACAAFLLHGLARARMGRLPGFAGFEPAPFHPGFALFAAFLGVLSHLGWDLVTHPYSLPVLLFLYRHMHWFHALDPRATDPVKLLEHSWYLASLGGTCIAVGHVAILAVRRARRTPGFRIGPWLVLGLVGLVPFVPVALVLPRMLSEAGGRIARLGTLAGILRLDMAASLGLVLLAFLALTRRPREDQAP